MEFKDNARTWSVKRLTSMVAGVAFFLLVGISAWMGYLPHWILSLYLVASLVTFILYAVDKSAARKGAWRMPESTLHLVSLAGGWPGALIAQQLLRHKTGKAGFQAMFWVTVGVNCAIVLWLI
jgi:uncharacterized membrane protein YsdA (DUF1294 family)